MINVLNRAYFSFYYCSIVCEAGAVSIKKKLERIQWKNYFINSHQEVLKETFELYEEVNNESPSDNESYKRLMKFTEKNIQFEEDNYDYCKNLLDQLEEEKYREVLYLRYFKGLTNERVAEETFYTIGYTTRKTKWAIDELERIERKAGLNGTKNK